MEKLINNGFCEMTENEMLELEGGGIWEALKAFAGGILVGVSPIVGVAGGGFAGAGVFGFGLSLIGSSGH